MLHAQLSAVEHGADRTIKSTKDDKLRCILQEINCIVHAIGQSNLTDSPPTISTTIKSFRMPDVYQRECGVVIRSVTSVHVCVCVSYSG